MAMARQELAEAVAFGVFDLIAKIGGRHFMGDYRKQ